jgi:hypothetical protein
VPAIAGGDQHGVEVRPRQQLAQVAVGDAVPVAVMGVGDGLELLAHPRLHVAGRDVLHVLFRHHRRQHHLAARADADAAEGDAVAGRHPATAAEDARRHHERGDRRREGLLQKAAPRRGRPPGGKGRC